MNNLAKLSVISILSIGGIGCDQSTKLLAKNLLQFEAPKSYLNDTLRIMYSENTGAFLGLGDSLPPVVQTLLLQIVVAIILCLLLYYLVTNKRLDATSVTGLTLIFAGGASNLFDRVTNNGAVVDFLNVGIGSIRTGIFNVADMVIMMGAIVFYISQRNINTDKSERAKSKSRH